MGRSQKINEIASETDVFVKALGIFREALFRSDVILKWIYPLFRKICLLDRKLRLISRKTKQKVAWMFKSAWLHDDHVIFRLICMKLFFLEIFIAAIFLVLLMN